MTDIRELAQRRAATKQAVTALGMMNQHPLGSDASIAQDARFMIAQDAAYKADREYQDALEKCSAEELFALIQLASAPVSGAQ